MGRAGGQGRGRPSNLKNEDIFSYVLSTSHTILYNLQKNGASGGTLKQKFPLLLQKKGQILFESFSQSSILLEHKKRCPYFSSLKNTAFIQGSFIVYRDKWSKTFETQCIYINSKVNLDTYMGVPHFFCTSLQEGVFLLLQIQANDSLCFLHF